METLPTSRRPGRHGPWRQLVKATAVGEVKSGVAGSAHEARLIGKAIRAAAIAEGRKARMSYAEPDQDGTTRWHVTIEKESDNGQ